MNGPPPTKLVLLSELPRLPLHSKVRFLGCVTRYDVATAHLVLEHNYPCSPGSKQARKPGSARSANHASVSVDINNILESVNRNDLQVGAWLNVLGYVRSETQRGDGPVPPSPANQICIEAVMIFAAGALHIGEYEKALRDVQEMDRRSEHPK